MTLRNEIIFSKEAGSFEIKNCIFFSPMQWPCYSGTSQEVSFPVSAVYILFRGHFDFFVMPFSVPEFVSSRAVQFYKAK